LIPVLAGMLTYVGCSSDESPTSVKTTSLEEQIADLQATIEAKGDLTEEEKSLLKNLKENTEEEEESVPLDEEVISNVPFAVIEEAPTYPGCEELADNEEKKECMSNSITAFVQKNFDTGLGKKLELTGINKVYVQFKIDASGNVEFMGSRGPHPALEKEAERVVNLLPHMKPGVQKGQNVGVLYALPIVFQVAQ
ncbi:MAG: energy transducer TonB, partial [Leeuwenhoekiella sp.]